MAETLEQTLPWHKIIPFTSIILNNLSNVYIFGSVRRYYFQSAFGCHSCLISVIFSQSNSDKSDSNQINVMMATSAKDVRIWQMI